MNRLWPKWAQAEAEVVCAIENRGAEGLNNAQFKECPECRRSGSAQSQTAP